MSDPRSHPLFDAFVTGDPARFWPVWQGMGEGERRAWIASLEATGVGALGQWLILCHIDMPGDFGGGISQQRWRDRIGVAWALFEHGAAAQGVGPENTFDHHPLMALVLPFPEWGENVPPDVVEHTVH